MDRLPTAWQDVSRYIADNWAGTFRQTGGAVDIDNPRLVIGRVIDAPDGPWEEICLPKPFAAPSLGGKDFQNFFYWDVYFTAEGLVRDGHVEMARNMADNLIFLIHLLGFVPCINVVAEAKRSQLPVASAMVRLVYDRTRDKAWLAKAHAALQREYGFWMTFRLNHTGLNNHGLNGDARDLDRFQYAIQNRLVDIPADPPARMRFQAHAMAESECWDFTPRFDRRCLDFVGVDLNAMLYLHETNAAFFCRELGNGQEARWEECAARRRRLFTQYCWNEDRGFFYDYDFVNGRHSDVACAGAYFAMWAGLPSEKQAARMTENLALMETEHGLYTCQPGPRPKGQKYQWDAPNMWGAPVFGALMGLQRYGYHDEARRIAGKYVRTVARCFQKSGQLWEKYNALTGDLDVRDEYAMMPILDFTAGPYQVAMEILGSA